MAEASDTFEMDAGDTTPGGMAVGVLKEKVPALLWSTMAAPTQPPIAIKRAGMNIPEALAAIKATYDLLSISVAARDEAKVQLAMSDLLSRLMDASNTALAQIQATHALEMEVQQLRMQAIQAQTRHAELEAQLKQRSQYKLTEVAPGKWVRELIEPTDTPEGSRKYFCATCYGQGREIPLEFVKADQYGSAQLLCAAGSNAHTLYLSR